MYNIYSQNRLLVLLSMLQQWLAPFSLIATSADLSDVLSHYELLQPGHLAHHIVRRSTDSEHADVRQVEFDSFGR